MTDPAYGAGSAGELDRFGGWTRKKFKATGFFRVENDDRWWLVTPEGNAFLSFGINHLHSGLLNGYGEPHPVLKKVLRTCADETYIVATR